MDDVAYFLIRYFGRPVGIVLGVLVVLGVLYGLIIGDVKKGFNDVYIQPASLFFTLVVDRAFEIGANRAARVTEWAQESTKKQQDIPPQ